MYTDSEGTLYHFVVEGTGFADASRVPAEVSVLWTVPDKVLE